ncbi:histone lysine methyltransferase Set9 [Thecaphora frezii]
MEDLSADDDILSDILLDTLEFEPAISTHKMNPHYRGQRFDRATVSQIVRKRVVVERDITKAIEDLGKLGIVQKYLLNKTQRQTASFQAHARRYLETYLPDSGVEFALTTRYKRVMMERIAHKSAAASANSPGDSDKPGESSKSAEPAEAAKVKEKGKGRHSLDRATTSIGAAPIASEKADLCVLAMHEFKVGDIVSHCKGGLKDLTKSEDEALREEAVNSREKRKEAEYKGVLGPGRDFSVISSSRKGCSQLLLGPARFVNHDCNPNAEFYRTGSQMTFKVIRPIARNEEITTYYGDNYFEWANSECMCATCELKGTGVFTYKRAASHVDPADGKGEEDGKDGAAAANGNGRRRWSRRSGRQSATGGSNAPSPSPTPSTSAAASLPASEEVPAEPKSRRDVLADLKLAQHGPSEDRSDPYAEGAGPQCRCLTCGATFWAPEKWWTPDECPRCERHYKIFKADWPERVPTEGLLARRGSGKRKFDTCLDKENGKSPPVRGLAPLTAPEQSTPHGKKRSRPAKASAPTTPASIVDVGSAASPATPITLSPLRDLSPAEARQAPKGKAKGSPLPHKPAAQPCNETATRSPKASSSEAIQQPDKLPEAAEVYRTTSRVALGGDSDDSDLTLESESDSDRDQQPGLRESISNASASGGSSSGHSPGLMGPKMLGKHAKTDVLAQYWGAPITDKRSRRKSSSHNALALLGARRSTPGADSRKSEPARQAAASDPDETPVSTKKPSKKRGLQSTPDREEEATTPVRPSANGSAAHRKTASMSDLAGFVDPKASEEKSSVAQGAGENIGGASADSAAPASKPRNVETKRASTPVAERKPPQGTPSIPGLATTGVERTSESNLALFWSAGVEGGRTRRQAHREPQTLTSSQSPVKRSRPSSEASRSRTPEVKRPRGRPPKQRVADSPGESPKADSVELAGIIEIKSEDMDLDVAEDARVQEGSASRNGRDQEAGGLVEAKSETTHFNGSATSKTPLPTAAMLRPDLLAVARANSPLAGPPPAGLRTGTPGQPIRKNLRWGNGKTSVSRPIGSISPLGRPLAGPNASPRPGLPLDVARTLQFPPSGVTSEMGSPKVPNGSMPSASAPPQLEAASDSKPRPATLAAPNDVRVGPEYIKDVSALDADMTDAESSAIIAPGNAGDKVASEPQRPAGASAKALKPLALSRRPEPQVKQGRDIALREASQIVERPQSSEEAATATNGAKPTRAGLPYDQHDAIDVSSFQQSHPVTSTSSVGNAESQATQIAVAPSIASPSAASAVQTLQRRVSGRARKPPEMAAGQIQYKGSLVKLAAKRAKEAKKTDSPTSRSAASTPQRSPTSNKGRRPAALRSPGKKNETPDSTPTASRRPSQNAGLEGTEEPEGENGHAAALAEPSPAKMLGYEQSVAPRYHAATLPHYHQVELPPAEVAGSFSAQADKNGAPLQQHNRS